MKHFNIDGKQYRLPNSLSDWQQRMYVHLINWKWARDIIEAGEYTYKGIPYAYDAILPKGVGLDTSPIIYPPALSRLKQHVQRFPFRIHKHFNHMASSQAANVNLFLPILMSGKADEILRTIRPDLNTIATEHLDGGFRIEFWDEGLSSLGDKNARSGTDSDIAIAYRNHSGELCLWLIEHKLTEAEFTTCGGFKSKGRQHRHDCSRPFSEIVADRHTCYYHDIRKFNYWNITARHLDMFPAGDDWTGCPFKGGMNQLWRNQLMALAIEDDNGVYKDYKHVHFSVVHHPDNPALKESMAQYRKLTGNNARFSSFTSDMVVRAAKTVNVDDLNAWAEWYEELYMVK